MLSFGEYLAEIARAYEKIHHNVTVRQAMKIIPHVKNQTVRYVIDKKDKLHIGASHIHTHDDLVNPKDYKHVGSISHHEGKYYYDAMVPKGDYEYKNKNHDHFKKYGFHHSPGLTEP